MKTSIKLILAQAVLAAVILVINPALGRAADTAAEAARYQALGGVYSESGFSEFPARETPFYGHPGYGYYRLTQRRHRGRLLYEDKSGTDIGHSYSCGRLAVIYVELWLPGGPKGTLPFAWQDPFLTCKNGGESSDSDPLYIDITGDGKPEIKFDSIGAVSQVVFEDGLKKRVFSKSIIPAWVKEALGSTFVEGQGEMSPGSAWIEPVYRPRDRHR
jgi:hypothetical protein